MIKLTYIKNMKKSKTRLFISKKLSENILIYIVEKQHHYLKNVMRVKVNDKIMLFDNLTGEWQSSIISISRDNIVLKVLNKIKNFYQEVDIWLLFSPIKQHRLNITIQKSTELGVSKFIPCVTEFTDTCFLNYKNLYRNIIEAAEQCDRLTIPSLEEQVSLKDLLINFPNDRALIYCNEKNHSNLSMFASLEKIKKKYKKWALLIGPEGGFSDQETVEISKIKTCMSVSLGSRVLRSDTAVTAALFCLQSIIESK